MEVATVASSELRISPAIESARFWRQDGDPVWSGEIVVNGHVPPALDSYFRNLAYIAIDHLGTERCIFSGFTPGARYIEKQPGNRTIYRPVSHQWYLGMQHCLKDYLTNLDPDTEVLEDPYSIIESNVIGKLGIDTNINPTTGWDGITLPAKQFIFRTNQQKLDMLREIEDYCVAMVDVRWLTVKALATDILGKCTFHYVSLGDIDTEFSLPSGGSIVTVTPQDPTLAGEITADDLAESNFNYVRISGYTAYYALPFKKGNSNTVLKGVVISGATSSCSATVIDVRLTSGSWAAGTAAGILVLDKDMKQTNPSPPPTNIEATWTVDEVLLQNGTARAKVSAAAYPWQEKVDWYSKELTTSQVTAGEQPAIEYVEEYEQDFDTEIAIDNRCADVYTYLTAVKSRFTAIFNRRADLQLYQALALSGFVKIPDGTYRIVGIEYFEKGPSLTVTCTLMLDTIWRAQRKLMKQFRKTAGNEIDKRIKAEAAKLTPEEKAIVQSITDGGVGIVQTTKGATIRGQVP